MLNHLKAMINETKPCNRWQESWTDAARNEEEENAIEHAGKVLEHLTW